MTPSIIELIQLSHFLLCILILLMTIDFALTCRKVGFELFRAKLFLNKSLLQWTLVAFSFALVLLAFGEWCGFCQCCESVIVRSLHELAATIFIILVLFIGYRWRNVIKQCVPKKEK